MYHSPRLSAEAIQNRAKSQRELRWDARVAGRLGLRCSGAVWHRSHVPSMSELVAGNQVLALALVAAMP